LNAFFICDSITRGRANDKKQQKRGNKTYIGNPTLIYMTSCRKFKEEKLSEKEIKIMKIGGVHKFKETLFKEVISTRGVNLLTMMSKGEK
jgi:hypothetical protein